jgi:hypothetical protein
LQYLGPGGSNNAAERALRGFPEFLRAPGLMSIAAVRRVETADDGIELF